MPRFHADDGLIVGLAACVNRVGGDFTGNLGLVDQYQIVFLPDIGTGTGMGFTIGGRRGNGEGDVSYSITSSDGRWGPVALRTKYYSLSADSRRFFVPHSRLQPFLQAGGGVAKPVVEDGSIPTDTVDFQVSDGRFWDFEFHGGGGVAWFLSPRISLRLTVVYRFVSFGGDRIERVAGAITPPRGVGANTLNMSLGTTCVF